MHYVSYLKNAHEHFFLFILHYIPDKDLKNKYTIEKGLHKPQMTVSVTV